VKVILAIDAAASTDSGCYRCFANPVSPRLPPTTSVLFVPFKDAYLVCNQYPHLAPPPRTGHSDSASPTMPRYHDRDSGGVERTRTRKVSSAEGWGGVEFVKRNVDL